RRALRERRLPGAARHPHRARAASRSPLGGGHEPRPPLRRDRPAGAAPAARRLLASDRTPRLRQRVQLSRRAHARHRGGPACRLHAGSHRHARWSRVPTVRRPRGRRAPGCGSLRLARRRTVDERAHPYAVLGAFPTPSTPALVGRFDRALPECQELTMSDRPLKVCVVGTGRIGLPLAAVLAEAGFEVVGYDTNDDFVFRVNTTGMAGFREDGLDELLARHLHSRLTLTSTPPVEQDVYIITVGTPLEAGEPRPNLDRI